MYGYRRITALCWSVYVVVGLGLFGCDEVSTDSSDSEGSSEGDDAGVELVITDLATTEDSPDCVQDIAAEYRTTPGCRMPEVVVQDDGAVWCATPQTTPVAIITTAEPAQVPIGTIVHLSAEDSFSCEGLAITQWQWDVFGPEPVGQLQPDWASETVEYQVEYPGLFKFYLVVYDELGTPSCFPAIHKVHCGE